MPIALRRLLGSSLVATLLFGCGGGGSPRSSVDVLVSRGTIGSIVVGHTDIFGVTIQGDGTPYRGAAYLIGSCSNVDDGNNVTSRTFEPLEALDVGEAVTWTGTLSTINGSNACLGPDYAWTLTRTGEHTLHSVVDVFNVRDTLLSLSLPSDFVKDPGNRFAYERASFLRTVDDCRTTRVDDFGLPYEGLMPTCHNGAGLFIGFGFQSPPSSFVEWRSDRHRVGLRRTILGGNYHHLSVFNAPGADNLQPSWDRGPIHAGSTLRGEEEWLIFVQ